MSTNGFSFGNDFEQELIVETANGDLVIRSLLIRGYPIIVCFTD